MKFPEKNASFVTRHFGCRVLLATAALLTLPSLAQAAVWSIFVQSDTTWRAIGPVGNLEGSPIDSVGLSWEAAHTGWNSSLSYDDSDRAGWRNSIYNGWVYGSFNGHAIWVTETATTGQLRPISVSSLASTPLQLTHS